MFRTLTLTATALALGLGAASAEPFTARLVEDGSGLRVIHETTHPDNALGAAQVRVFGTDDERVTLTDRVLIPVPGRAGALALIETNSVH